jgi:hypothetical protein
MALPKVTYGTYNYGEYARPTAIKYKGGLGEGIAQGLAKGVSSYMEAKEEKKQFVKKVDTEVVKERARFGDALDIAAGSKFAEGENKKFIKQMKEDYGNAYRQWRLGNISAEEYEKTRSGLMGDLRNIASVKDQAMGALQLDIKEEDVRNTTNDLLRSERRDGFGKGLYLLGRDKDNNLTYTVETSGGAQTYVGMKILNDEKFFLPSLKYDNSVNASFNSAAPNLLKLLAGTKPEYHTETVKGGYKYDTIDFDKHGAEIKASLMSSPNFTNILNDKTFDAKAYYEDNLGNLDKGNTYTGSAKQEEEIRQALADEVIQNAKINNISFNKRALPASPKEKINSATVAINNSVLNPVDFYNSHIYQSPHLEDGAEPTDTPGIIKLKTYSEDGTLIPTTMDLRKKAVFAKFVGYIGKKHPSVDGRSNEVRDAVANINLDELHKKFMDSLPKEKKSENSDIQNQFGVSPEMAKAIGDNLKLSNENNDFSQQK